jgi:hypothetical protein
MKKSGSPDSEMAPDHPSTPSWKALFRIPGFPFFFVAMLVSLFGTGMNFAGVTWYVLGATHSTVKVSLIVILVTLPGLVVPPFGGVLIDRVDRRYLGIIVDAARAVVVMGTVLDGAAVGGGIRDLLVDHECADPGTRPAGTIDNGQRHRAHCCAGGNGGGGSAGRIHL